VKSVFVVETEEFMSFIIVQFSQEICFYGSSKGEQIFINFVYPFCLGSLCQISLINARCILSRCWSLCVHYFDTTFIKFCKKVIIFHVQEQSDVLCTGPSSSVHVSALYRAPLCDCQLNATGWQQWNWFLVSMYTESRSIQLNTTAWL
jgi:hypothetical protein